MNPLGRLQRRKQLAKLTVYKNAQGLERARRRMDIAGAVTENGPHDMCKVMCGGNCLIGARIHNGTGDLARMPLVAKRVDDAGEIPLTRRIDHVSGARAFCAHAHVERTVESEREPALGGIELHRRDAEIKDNTVDRFVPSIARDRFEIGEPVFDQREAAARLLNQIRAQRDCSLIAVDADHLAIGGRENGARIAAGAEGAVDIDATIAGLEVADRMATEHGNVEGRSASDSQAVAARHHSRAPGALRAATWELRLPLSARTFWVASASSFWKRPGSQI